MFQAMPRQSQDATVNPYHLSVPTHGDASLGPRGEPLGWGLRIEQINSRVLHMMVRRLYGSTNVHETRCTTGIRGKFLLAPRARLEFA